MTMTTRSREDRKPPSDAEHLRLYCDLVDEYDQLGTAFPVDLTSWDLFVASPVTEADRWHLIVRAMTLRKFVLGRDHIRCDRVLDALEKCLPAPGDRDLSGAREAFSAIGTVFSLIEVPGQESTLEHVLEDHLYGSLLHGDYGRHERMVARARSSTDFAAWVWVLDAERFVRHVRRMIRLADEEGLHTEEAHAVLAKRAS